ncbi:MAG TPA: LysM peptidoglycan-binding domain-containing protein, partial [Chloroflexota bacterium]|nr:LysM peptidoglycan-binding domain-containing protein [Chloroflexota bacterium]
MNDTYRNHADNRPAAASAARRFVALVWLIGFAEGLALGGGLLHRLVGPPRVPSPLPRWSDILLALGAADVPTDALVYLFGMTAWAIWIWLAGTAVLRLVVVAAEAVTGGAAWLGGLRRVSDRITSPLVRRIVDGAVVATVVVNVVGRAAPAAAAGSEMTGPVVTTAPLDLAARRASTSVPVDQVHVLYTVRDGDNLWRIAERHYGKGEEFARIVEANAGRQMSDGRTFTRSAVIQPGWVLRIPLPDRTADEIAATGEDQRVYVVRPGDTLGSIAAQLLGDSQAWPALFEANRGVAALEDGRTLADPHLIWPGLRLRAPRLASEERADELGSIVRHEIAGTATATAGESARDERVEPEVAPAPEPVAVADPGRAGEAETLEVLVAQPSVVEESVVAGPHSEADATSGAGDGAFLPALSDVLESADAATADPIAPMDSGNAAERTEATEAIVATVAALAAVGGAAGLARRRPHRARRSLTEPPPEMVGPVLAPHDSGPPIDGDSAAEELDRALVHRRGGADLEPVVLLTDAVLRLL